MKYVICLIALMFLTSPAEAHQWKEMGHITISAIGIESVPIYEVPYQVNGSYDLKPLQEDIGVLQYRGKYDYGNTIIVGHNFDAGGGAFEELDRLRYGDEIEIFHDGVSYVFVVESLSLVYDWQISYIAPTNYVMLTLQTCVDGDTTRRLIIQAYPKEK